MAREQLILIVRCPICLDFMPANGVRGGAADADQPRDASLYAGMGTSPRRLLSEA